MSDLFSDDLIDIELNYIVEKSKSGVSQVTVLDDDKAATMKADPLQKDKVKTLRTKWKPITWAASNELISRSTSYNHHIQQNQLDYTKLRDSKLKLCLVDWDAKKENGEPVPCVEANLNKLHAGVALALINKYDEALTVPSDDQAKN